MVTAEQLTQWMSNYRSFIVYDKALAEEFINKMKSVKEAEVSIDNMCDLFIDWLMSQGLEEEAVL